MYQDRWWVKIIRNKSNTSLIHHSALNNIISINGNISEMLYRLDNLKGIMWENRILQQKKHNCSELWHSHQWGNGLSHQSSCSSCLQTLIFSSRKNTTKEAQNYKGYICHLNCLYLLWPTNSSLLNTNRKDKII